MASQLILPGGARPSNLHLNPETDKARYVTSDQYHIAERLAEISDRLYIVELQRGSRFGYAIMENCDDGVQRLHFRVAADGLDARVLERTRRNMALSLHDRIAECERERETWERAQQEAASEEAYERLGGPMYHQLHHDGFAHGGKRESFKPMNRTARRHGRRMA